MNGIELHMWRWERKVTQTDLAKALGVSRRTVINWEQGTHRLPMAISARLEQISITLMPKPVVEPPRTVNRDSAPLRPDLHLFDRRKVNGLPAWGTEHPQVLIPESSQRDGLKWPWSVLESDEYLTALAQHRSGAATG